MCQIEGNLYQWRPIRSVAYPGSGAFFDPWIRDPDPGWTKIQSQDPGSGMEKKVQNQESGSGIRGGKKIQIQDPGSGMNSEHPGSNFYNFFKILICESGSGMQTEGISSV
jgi:hypothetical protein